MRIDKNVPVPENWSRKMKYPWRGMSVGDSVFVPALNPSDAVQATNAANSYARYHGWKIKRRYSHIERGLRIWRVA